jgi:3-hydroxybutyryl-CoA dehydrogenase
VLQIYLLSTTYFCKKNYFMKVAVFANDQQWGEITNISASISWLRLEALNKQLPDVAAYFILYKIHEFDYSQTKKPVFIHSVNNTLQMLNAHSNILRINAWHGFLHNDNWEIAGDMTEEAKIILATLNKKYIQVKDIPGLVAARIIAMIINEAYFALGEDVSGKHEIDMAMKSGTSYPYGPFEWAELIGVNNICSLLEILSATDKRYLPAPLLEKEAAACH